MIADCETCDRKQVPCKSCQESQRAICYRCDGDVDDPYCEMEGPDDAPLCDFCGLTVARGACGEQSVAARCRRHTPTPEDGFATT